ncbi:MAG: hydantoinase B/oxoprolinase family protein, partial [Gammaproteobacteria bacterium]
GQWHNPLLCAFPFNYGETFMFESTGGGGYGNPLEREPQQVLDDVLDEYISPTTARKVYGVVIEGEQVDSAATAALRGSLATVVT